MLRTKGKIQLSASDLVGHLGCRHLTNLEIAVAQGALERPKIWDPTLQVLRERGALHEENYIQHLEEGGFRPMRIVGAGVEEQQVQETIEAMRRGSPIIIQGALSDEKWGGRPDILRRVESRSELGEWSYEVVDTKLARETKGGTVLQLCLYSDLLTKVQGVAPEFMYVVSPGMGFEPGIYRTSDYAAYYRLIKSSLESSVEESVHPETYPDPKEHCDICRWRLQCDGRRRVDDHLCLVAGISKLNINELKTHGVESTGTLAAVPLPIPWKPERGAVQTYERIREQARVQVEGRSAGKVLYEILQVEPGFGLTSLPEPSAGDIFLDLEGDPYVEGGGLEYLFGYTVHGKNGERDYSSLWALSRDGEKRAFECFIDFVMRRWVEYPDLHIYHFGPYEEAALKRLMGRYATRQEEIDRLLRASVLVDLYGVVRHSIRASVESYSIKHLEVLYGLERSVALTEANRALAHVQRCLEMGDCDDVAKESRSLVQAYNRDDCLSAHGLRDWLEGVRKRLVDDGISVSRPALGTGDASEEISEWETKINELADRLASGVPAQQEERSNEEHAQWILANILDWHRREEKAVWWEYFRLRELSGDELLEERSGIGGLVFVSAVGGTARAPVHRYRFPAQETDLRGGEDLRGLGGEPLGKLESFSFNDRTIDIKKRGVAADVHPSGVFGHQIVPSKILAEALIRIGEAVADTGIGAAGPYGVARDLLLRELPHLGGAPIRTITESPFDAAIRVARELRGGVLPIQGPPGAGKTFTGARMICEMVASGARVGITATSHKVIRHLLDEIVTAGKERNIGVKCIQKVSEKEDDREGITFTNKNEHVFSALGSSCQVAAGTAWLWARPEARESVDVLFVDEAAQMSLANVLAVSHACTRLVLLGDPQQLDQPMQGNHPDGTAVSALDHMLGNHMTIESERGLFLEETWRLHPAICAFTSEMFYESRLKPRPGLEKQRIVASGPIEGSGLRYLPVRHEGNQNASPEEANMVYRLIRTLLDEHSRWIDMDGNERELSLDDVLIIAPYNAQVFELRERLPGGRIGTVDKFQGQEAPVVIYSMATSTPEEAPHGMEFLFSLNRLNVATSRARCVSVLVGAPALFEPECRTPRQMQLANAFCRYRELADVISL